MSVIGLLIHQCLAGLVGIAQERGRAGLSKHHIASGQECQKSDRNGGKENVQDFHVVFAANRP